jgi:hypothetical protein
MKDYHINMFFSEETAAILPTFRISKPVQPSETLQKKLWQRWSSPKLHGLKPRAWARKPVPRPRYRPVIYQAAR